ncbi:hypothetical protein MN2019_12995 [Mycolicibacterium neoaurum]|uniref:hypothetical protein n=1 Tax=Mycolicibacterium neoaurum TaxID=1795 RepID=UPI001BCFAA9D|nr:hypothetical protein [Mycolicibacterium neoaurum]QVI30125.1 hypothetical protein MN2019_12995 [Mycolicibacterium neoaurum]
MNTLAFTAATIAVALTPAIPLAANAAAAGPTGSSVAQTVDDLRAQGYSVQVNGAGRSGSLANCSVSSIRERKSLGASVKSVYVHVNCPLGYDNR